MMYFRQSLEITRSILSKQVRGWKQFLCKLSTLVTFYSPVTDTKSGE